MLAQLETDTTLNNLKIVKIKIIVSGLIFNIGVGRHWLVTSCLSE